MRAAQSPHPPHLNQSTPNQPTPRLNIQLHLWLLEKNMTQHPWPSSRSSAAVFKNELSVITFSDNLRRSLDTQSQLLLLFAVDLWHILCRRRRRRCAYPQSLQVFRPAKCNPSRYCHLIRMRLLRLLRAIRRIAVKSVPTSTCEENEEKPRSKH